jgi:spore coat polysaccharide biosynthesis protein SpsF
MTRTYPRGLDTEVFSFSVLEKTQIQATRKYEMEHVTPYVYEHPEYFRLINVSNEFDYSGYRWTLDTSEDFRLIQEIYKELYRDNGMFTFKDVLELFDIRPELREINAYVEQKDYRYNK